MARRHILVRISPLALGTMLVGGCAAGPAPPPGYHLESKPRLSLVIPGAATFVAVYAASVIAGAAGESTQREIEDECRAQGAAGGCTREKLKREESITYVPMYVPLVGPFITAETTGAAGIPLSVLAMSQIAGTSLVVVGLALPSHELVPDGAKPARLRVLPSISRGGGGLSLLGSM